MKDLQLQFIFLFTSTLSSTSVSTRCRGTRCQLRPKTKCSAGVIFIAFILRRAVGLLLCLLF